MNSATSDSDEARLAAARGDYATAARLWRHLADGGDSVAQFNLGFSYAQGQGVPRDKVQAAQWYRLAAKQGHAEAQYRLGLLCVEESGFDPDEFAFDREAAEDAKASAEAADEGATEWFSTAAEQGHADAQFALGQHYMYRKRTQKEDAKDDYEVAAKWYREAARQGHASAQVSLGIMCTRGEGMPKDFLQAYMWFDLAASCGTNSKHRSLVLDMRTAATQKMAPEQIAEAQRLAREWKSK